MPPPLVEVVAEAEALGVVDVLGLTEVEAEALGVVDVLGLTEVEAEALGVVDVLGLTEAEALGVFEALVSPVSVQAANTKQLTAKIAATITAAKVLILLILFLLNKLNLKYFIINYIKKAIYRINRTFYRINCIFQRLKR